MLSCSCESRHENTTRIETVPTFLPCVLWATAAGREQVCKSWSWILIKKKIILVLRGYSDRGWFQDGGVPAGEDQNIYTSVHSVLILYIYTTYCLFSQTVWCLRQHWLLRSIESAVMVIYDLAYVWPDSQEEGYQAMTSKPEEASDFLSPTLADTIGRKHSCGFDLLKLH